MNQAVRSQNQAEVPTDNEDTEPGSAITEPSSEVIKPGREQKWVLNQEEVTEPNPNSEFTESGSEGENQTVIS